jgi:cation-transporting ATPase E
VLLARADRLDADGALPVGLRPSALIILEEQVRVDAADAVAYFLRQGVELRVISGDNPLTVGAVAARVGVPRADEPVDARQLPEEPGPLADLLAERTVYGRVTPQQKQDMVAALQARGHVVAMTGDGVNDVLALKDADLGIAMGGGTAAARAVARVVLLDGAFSSLPAVVAEGRRVIANVERVANLFITKTVYAVLLAVVIGLLAVPYPFLPRHFTLISAFAIGIPGFFLALGPAHQPARPDFVRRVMRFVAVSGPVVGVGVLVVYGLARAVDDDDLLQSQTAATLALLGLSLAVLVQIARPLTPARLVLVAAMGGAAALALVVPSFRDFFALDVPTARSWMTAAAAVAVGTLLLLAAYPWMRPEQPAAAERPG